MPRGNVNNLRTPTTEEAREIGRKGGLASAAARKKRKTLRDELLALLSEGNTQESITLSLLEKAMDGDVKAFEVVRDTIGEKPVDKVVVAEVDPAVIEEIESMVCHDENASD